MDAKSAPDPRFSEDRQWWWDGSRWVPASQASDQARRRPMPQWAQRVVEGNRKRWRWVMSIGLGAAVALAVFDLVSGWEVPSSALALVVAVGLMLVAVAACIALLVFSADERRTLAGDADSLKVVAVAARGVRWSSLFAMAISVLLFANCSAGATSGDSSSGATTHPGQFWVLAALVVIPLLVAIALPAVLAMAASRFAGKGRLREARMLASICFWSAGLLAVVALLTAGFAFFRGVSECFLVSTSSSCAAGLGGLMNPTAIASLLVIVPYLILIKRALSTATSRPDG